MHKIQPHKLFGFFCIGDNTNEVTEGHIVLIAPRPPVKNQQDSNNQPSSSEAVSQRSDGSQDDDSKSRSNPAHTSQPEGWPDGESMEMTEQSRGSPSAEDTLNRSSCECGTTSEASTSGEARTSGEASTSDEPSTSGEASTTGEASTPGEASTSEPGVPYLWQDEKCERGAGVKLSENGWGTGPYLTNDDVKEISGCCCFSGFCKFPSHPTAFQFFTPPMFTAYHREGYRACMECNDFLGVKET